MKRNRIIKATKVSSSNPKKSRLLFGADTKPQRLIKLGFITHTSRVTI